MSSTRIAGDWYYLRDDTPVGPIPWTTIKLLLESQDITPETFVSQIQDENWARLKTIKAGQTTRDEPADVAQEDSAKITPSSDSNNSSALTVLWWIMGIATLVFVVLVVVPFLFNWVWDVVVTLFKGVMTAGEEGYKYDRQQVAEGEDKAWYIRIFTNPWAIGFMVVMLLWTLAANSSKK
jgi:hypothetical protein